MRQTFTINRTSFCMGGQVNILTISSDSFDSSDNFYDSSGGLYNIEFDDLIVDADLYNRFRVKKEIVYDSVLDVSGNMNLYGGLSVGFLESEDKPTDINTFNNSALDVSGNMNLYGSLYQKGKLIVGSS